MKDFPVEFRNDDLISSYEALCHYRTAYELIDDNDPPSDFDIAYIMKTIDFYETRISQIRAGLDWFEFIDAECTYDILYADKHANMLAIYNLHTTANHHKQRALYFSNNNCPIVAQSHLQKAYDAEWMLFMEAN